jgi:dihydroorotate dehydrogenase (fumarate)
MSNMSVKLGAITLTAPVFNSAGPRATTLEDLQEIADSASGAVVTKSFSLVPWQGNPEPNLYLGEHYSINSIGLQNKGADYFIDASSRLRINKPLIASLVGKTAKEYAELAKLVDKTNFDAIELNLSCPNVVSKEPIGFSPDATDKLLQQIFKQTSKPISVKLPPCNSREDLRKMAGVITSMPINHVVLLNTYPLAAVINKAGRPGIGPNDGVGGLGGAALKPISIAHVMLFRHFTGDAVPIVGVGGVQNRQDVVDYLNAGATAVQVGTATINSGVRLFCELAF